MSSTQVPLDDRIETPIDGKTKETYREHAKKRYGLGLAAWIRMLMVRDFSTDK